MEDFLPRNQTLYPICLIAPRLCQGMSSRFSRRASLGSGVGFSRIVTRASFVDGSCPPKMVSRFPFFWGTWVHSKAGQTIKNPKCHLSLLELERTKQTTDLVGLVPDLRAGVLSFSMFCCAYKAWICQRSCGNPAFRDWCVAESASLLSISRACCLSHFGISFRPHT